MLDQMCSTLLISFSHAVSHSLWFFLSSFCSYKKHVWQLDFFSWSGSVPVPWHWTLLPRRSSPKQHVEIIDYRQNKGYKPHQECTSPLSSVFFLILMLVQPEESTLIAHIFSLSQVPLFLWVQEVGKTQKENLPRKGWLAYNSKSAACWSKYERLLNVGKLSCVP